MRDRRVIAELDVQVRTALHALAKRVRGLPFHRVRERELVSWFALGFLARAAVPGHPLFDPGQIGVEVAVPQMPSSATERRRRDVCKDIVLWRQPYETCWDAAGNATRYPMGVIEWKYLPKPVPPGRRKARLENTRTRDIEWLVWLSQQGDDIRGYSIVAENTGSALSFSAAVVVSGAVASLWAFDESSGEAS